MDQEASLERGACLNERLHRDPVGTHDLDDAVVGEELTRDLADALDQDSVSGPLERHHLPALDQITDPNVLRLCAYDLHAAKTKAAEINYPPPQSGPKLPLKSGKDTPG